MRRIFVELPGFTRLTSSGQMSDADVASIQKAILNGGGIAIKGTDGVKKIRAAAGQGKRGGWRVMFADYDEYSLTVLIWAFAKNVQETLTGKQRNAIRTRKRELDEEVKARYGKKR